MTVFRRFLIDMHRCPRSCDPDAPVSHTRRKLHNVANDANNSDAATIDLNGVYRSNLFLRSRCYPQVQNVPDTTVYAGHFKICCRIRKLGEEGKVEEKNFSRGNLCEREKEKERERERDPNSKHVCSLFAGLFQTGFFKRIREPEMTSTKFSFNNHLLSLIEDAQEIKVSRKYFLLSFLFFFNILPIVVRTIY